MREAFIEKNFKRETIVIIDAANSIIDEMQKQGYTLTVRQLYYQFVARGLLENAQTNYKKLAGIIDDARKAGWMDWDAIEDRTRVLRGYGHGFPLYTDPAAFIADNARNYYHEDLWDSQEFYCEVWVEKDALLGVIERPCNRWRVPYFACRGYASSSALYEAGKRFRAKAEEGKNCYLFHLGDHDPSGIDMTRANRVSVNDFANPSNEEFYGYAEGNRAFHVDDSIVTVERLALNRQQVRRYNPPPNPAKEADPRAKDYVAEHGEISWELDALSPPVLDAIIDGAIRGIMDEDLFAEKKAEETENREKLLRIAGRWDEVAAQFGGE
jgi:hypothetical protein